MENKDDDLEIEFDFAFDPLLLEKWLKGRKDHFIKAKIANVPDVICYYCHQMWIDSCKALTLPSDEREWRYRANKPAICKDLSIEFFENLDMKKFINKEGLEAFIFLLNLYRSNRVGKKGFIKYKEAPGEQQPSTEKKQKNCRHCEHLKDFGESLHCELTDEKSCPYKGDKEGI